MKTLSKILFLPLIITISVSCNDRNNDVQEITNVKKVKIDSVKIVNDTMDVYSVQSIRTYSTYGSGCEDFYGYDYTKDNFTRNVTAYQYSVNGPCTQALHTEANQFNFQPVQTGTYTFKFWNGDNNWIMKTIVVK